MKRLFKMMAAFVVAATFSSAPAVAQMTCNTYAAMTISLQMRFSETRRDSWQISSTTIIELWAAGVAPFTWSILWVGSNGNACIISSGNAFFNDEFPPLGKPA